MTSHHWKHDKDGAESCAREGCTVRRWPKDGSWQSRKRGSWRLSPIPPCTGKDAAPEAKTDGLDPLRLGRIIASGDFAKPAPSPLEVVLNMLPHRMDCAWHRKAGCTCHSGAALATLEESIRAQEREACARVADLADGVSTSDRRRVATAIRNRK